MYIVSSHTFFFLLQELFSLIVPQETLLIVHFKRQLSEAKIITRRFSQKKLMKLWFYCSYQEKQWKK